MVLAAGERDLELAPEILHVIMTQQKVGQRARIGRDIEGLVVTHARQWAGRHIAHGVATGLTRGQANRGQATHQIGRVVDVYVVQLKVLARRNVQDAVRVLVGQICQRLHLRDAQAAIRYLDALHARRIPHGVRALRECAGWKVERPRLNAVVTLTVVIALSVDAAAQARLGKHLFIQAVLAAQFHLALEDVDFMRQIRRHFVL